MGAALAFPLPLFQSKALPGEDRRPFSRDIVMMFPPTPMMMPKLQSGYNACAMIIYAKKRESLLANVKESVRKGAQTDQDAFPAE